MGHQKPADDHPWKRSYKAGRINHRPETKQKRKRVDILIKEFAESWDTIEVFTHKKSLLKYLPQEKQAGWLISILKNYEKENIYKD